MLSYNIDNGFIDGIVRGYKLGLLTNNQYSALTQCETLEDLKIQMLATDYAPYFQQDSQPLTTSTIYEKCIDFYYDQFEFIRLNSCGTLTKILDFIRCGYMIDNVILLISGTLHGRDVSELLPRCHPLGVFDGMEALTTSTSAAELYQTVLIASPLAPYFELCISAKDLNDKNLQIIRNILYKAYLEDFYSFCVGPVGDDSRGSSITSDEVDSATCEQMRKLLAFESDRQTIEIAVNSIKTGLSPSEKMALFPGLGELCDFEVVNRLAQAEDVSDIQNALTPFPSYRKIAEALKSSSFNESEPSTALQPSVTPTMDDLLYSMEVSLHRSSFFGQFHYANFYSFCRLKEQEIRNILWIAECIAHKQRGSINKFVPIF